MEVINQIFISNNKIEARVCEWGNRDSQAIVCIHGLGSTNLSFLELAEMLSDRYYIVSIDLPGHGKTPSFTSDEEYSMPNQTTWLDEVIKALEIERFYMMAHSYGGCIALHYIEKYYYKVKKLLLLDGGYHIKEISYDYFSKADNNDFNGTLICSLSEEIDFYEDDFDEYIFSEWEGFLESEKNNYLRWSSLLEIACKDLMKEEDGQVKWIATSDTARGALISMYNYPTNKINLNTNIPILLLVASLPKSWEEVRDIQIKEFDKRFKSEIIVIPGVTHFLHWDNPKVIEKHIRDWFREVE